MLILSRFYLNIGAIIRVYNKIIKLLAQYFTHFSPKLVFAVSVNFKRFSISSV